MTTGHLDLLGRTVKEDDYVAFTHHNSLYVGKVTKITPKQVRVIPLDGKRWGEQGLLKYTSQCCLVGGAELTFHILKNG